jgi:hypothetical protein
VARVRVAAPTSFGLECTGFRASEAFLKKCKTDVPSLLILGRIQRLTAISRAMRVPASEDEREAIRKVFSAQQFGMLEVWQTRIKMWRKRIYRSL